MGLIIRRWGCALVALLFAAVSVPADAQSTNGSHDFDFGIGTFKTHIRELQHPLTGSTAWIELSGTVVTRKIWDAGGNLEELEAGSGENHFQGITLRLYDTKTHQWNLYWVDRGDGAVGKPMVGSFKRGRGAFYDKETVDGRLVLVRNIYSDATANTYHFEQAYSPDNGKTWETNFIANLTRAAQ